MNNHKEISSAP